MQANRDSRFESDLLQVLAWVVADHSEAEESAASIGELICSIPTEELEGLCIALLAELNEGRLRPVRLRQVLQNIASRLLVAPRLDRNETCDLQSTVEPEILYRLFTGIVSIDATASAHILQCLAAQADPHSLEVIVRCLSEDSSQDWKSVGLGLSPLWRAPVKVLDDFFQTIGPALERAAVVPVVLDLANHSVRSGRLSEHPLAARAEMLTSLLKQLVGRLEKLHETPAHFGGSVEEIQKVLGDSVALAVSLCDALGLIGHEESKVALSQAMQLSHRRIQTEAAASLVRLGDPAGRQRLVDLAADPVARRRVVQYAEELELVPEIDQQYRYPMALAESELAAWLSSPEQFGLPPSTLQHVDMRTLYWPGYEEPRDCYLFQFQYQFPAGEYLNFGIAGPLTHAFAVSLSGLDIDDMYAAFAGWHAEHDEIYEVPVVMMNLGQQREAQKLEEAFLREGFQVETKIALTFLLGEPSLLARLKRDGQSFTGITDGYASTYFEVGRIQIASSPDLVLAVYRGRKLLRAFNE